jgi:hypothetical protein
MEDTNPKTQHGLKKAQHHLTPTTALEEMAGAFELGAKKYGAFNWREKTVSASTYVSAAKRHIDAWWERQETDPESGRHHLGHALACLAILIDAQKFKNLVDDRPKVGLHGSAPSKVVQTIEECLANGSLVRDPSGFLRPPGR